MGLDVKTAKTLCIAVPALAMAVVGGNFYTAQAPCPPPDSPCECVVKELPGIRDFGPETKTSCSVKSARFGRWSKLERCEKISAEWRNKIVTCSKGLKAVLNCGSTGHNRTVMVQGNARLLSCGKGRFGAPIIVDDDPKTAPAKKKPTLKGNSLDGPAGAARRAEAEGGATLVAKTAVLHLSEDADASVENEGRDRQALIVSAGTVRVESLCTGEAFTVAAPAIVTLPQADISGLLLGRSPGEIPTCAVQDLTGRWRGRYSRNPADESDEGIAVMLDIKGPEEASLEIDGQALTVSRIHARGAFYVEARWQDASGLREVILRGVPDKGDAMLEVSESWKPAEGSSSQTWQGFAWLDRLYIAQNALPAAVADAPYEAALIASSPSPGETSFRLAEGRLPAGITLDEATGALSGTATEEGEFKLTVEAEDAAGDTFRQALTLLVEKIVIAAVLPDGFAGQTYQTKLQARGGKPPYVWSLRFPFSLMPGLHLDPATGQLTFTPADRKTTSLGLMVEVRDSAGDTGEGLIEAAMRKTTILGSSFLPDGAVGAPYSHRFEAAGNAGPVEWSVDADLAQMGLFLNEATGEISGIPSHPATVLLKVSAREEDSSTSREFLLEVGGPETGAENSAQARRGPHCAPCAQPAGAAAGGRLSGR